MTKIEWTDATWNPLVGCSVTSPGCTNCYAMRMAGRLEGMASTNASLAHYVGTTQRSKAGFVWTGKVNMAPDSILTAPLRRRKPTRYFVNSMADLFHESVPDEWIDRVFAVMALAPQHSFQVLTKRSARMREYFRENNGWRARIAWLLNDLKPSPLWNGNVYQGWQNLHGQPDGLPNVWLGVSVEDQQRADERIPDLLATPAAVRFLSCEPLLGAVRLTHLKVGHSGELDGMTGRWRSWPLEESGGRVVLQQLSDTAKIDWVIAGGESGPNARPMHPDWARSLRDQCQSAGVPFFFKQWGEWAPVCEMDEDAIDACYYPAPESRPEATRRAKTDSCVLHQSGDIFTGESKFRRPAFEQGSRAMTMFSLGKARAGRLLDGREWSEFPA